MSLSKYWHVQHKIVVLLYLLDLNIFKSEYQILNVKPNLPESQAFRCYCDCQSLPKTHAETLIILALEGWNSGLLFPFFAVRITLYG